MEAFEIGTQDVAKVKRSGNEAAMLEKTLGIINNPEFVEGDVSSNPGKFVSTPMAGAEGESLAVEPMPVPSRASRLNSQPPHPVMNIPRPAAAGRAMIPVPQKAQPVQQAAPAMPTVTQRKKLGQIIFTTGRLKAGKDFVLGSLGYKLFALADPLYGLQEMFFGTKDKNLPGARKFLQQVGQWGRGVVTEKYPLTAQRAIFTQMIRALAEDMTDKSVQWRSYGMNENIWIDSLCKRIQTEQGVSAAERVGVTGVRFANEFEALKAIGGHSWHVMCSPQTLANRLREVGLNENSPEINDTSEEMAKGLDADALKNGRLPGGKLRVIWSDTQAPCPSSRFYTLAELE